MEFDSYKYRHEGFIGKIRTFVELVEKYGHYISSMPTEQRDVES